MPGEQGRFDERRVQKLDLVDRPIAEAIEVFRKYLTYERVNSGDALKCAQGDYKNLSNRRIAFQNIPVAWKNLAKEPDSELMDLIAKKIESLCGHRPGPEDIEQFLVELDGGTGTEAVIPAPAGKIFSTALVSERDISYKISGQSKQAANAIDALLDILQTLAARNPQFLEKLLPESRCPILRQSISDSSC